MLKGFLAISSSAEPIANSGSLPDLLLNRKGAFVILPNSELMPLLEFLATLSCCPLSRLRSSKHPGDCLRIAE